MALPSDPDALARDLDAALPDDGGLVLFDGALEADALAAADALAQRRSLRLHRVHAADLLHDRFGAVRGNLREVFDEAHAASLLLLTEADALLTASPALDDDDPEGPPASVRLRRYLLDRTAAFEGIVALAVASVAPYDDLRSHAVVVPR